MLEMNLNNLLGSRSWLPLKLLWLSILSSLFLVAFSREGSQSSPRGVVIRSWTIKQQLGDGHICLLFLNWAWVYNYSACVCLKFLSCWIHECKPHWLLELGNLGALPWVAAIKFGVLEVRKAPSREML